MTTLDDLARVERELRDESRRLLGGGFQSDTTAAYKVNIMADTIAAYIAEQREREVVVTATRRPPDREQLLYWFAPGSSWHVGKYDAETDSFGGRSGFCDHHDATHWMPLPAAPSGTKEPAP